MASKITGIHGREVLDSRGNPTIEVEVHTSSGVIGHAQVPSGASTGSREALELRDHDKKRYLGKGVLKAIDHIHHLLAPKLIGHDVCDQIQIDQLMLQEDGTPFKSHLGANSILGISLACARAGAAHWRLPLFRYLREILKAPVPKNEWTSRFRLPGPMMNIINGGAHASNSLAIQEFMILPHRTGSFSENLRMGVEVFHTLKKVLHQKHYSTNVGDEGGFAPDLKTHEEAMDVILQAIEQAGYQAGEDFSLCLDVAASEFYEEQTKRYQLDKAGLKSTITSEELQAIYVQWKKRYPLFSIEDGLSEADQAGWGPLTETLGKKTLLVGDDLFVTNKKIFAEGIKEKKANAILVKVNQIGTLTETFETIQMAYDHHYRVIVSHRSGETSDSFIADLAVATNSGLIKTGSASRTDRVEKYNQLLRIEEMVKDQGLYIPEKTFL